MQIVELVDSLSAGGTERMVADLSIALQARGHGVRVVCLRGSGPCAEPLHVAGIEVLPLGKPEGMHLSTVGVLTRYLKENRIDVVHTHNPLVHHYGVVCGYQSGAGAVINTTHGINNLENRFGKRETVFRLFSRLGDGVVAVCTAAQQKFSQTGIIPQNKLSVIENGIPLSKLLTLAPRTQRDPFVFGILGRLAEVKNHKGLLRAFSAIRNQLPHARLEIAGDGPMRSELEAQAKELGILHEVIFHGHTTDVASLMGGWNVMVLSSLSEGLPLAILEAMAAGLPIIGTDVGGIPDIVHQAGCGWICPRADTDALAAAMAAAMHSPALGEKGLLGRAYVKKCHSVEKMAEEYEQLFERVLAKKVRMYPSLANGRS